MNEVYSAELPSSYQLSIFIRGRGMAIGIGKEEPPESVINKLYDLIEQLKRYSAH